MSDPNTNTLVIEVRVTWWLLVYLNALVFFCTVMNTLPDEEKLETVIKRGIKARVLK